MEDGCERELTIHRNTLLPPCLHVVAPLNFFSSRLLVPSDFLQPTKSLCAPNAQLNWLFLVLDNVCNQEPVHRKEENVFNKVHRLAISRLQETRTSAGATCADAQCAGETQPNVSCVKLQSIIVFRVAGVSAGLEKVWSAKCRKQNVCPCREESQAKASRKTYCSTRKIPAGPNFEFESGNDCKKRANSELSDENIVCAKLFLESREMPCSRESLTSWSCANQDCHFGIADCTWSKLRTSSQTKHLGHWHRSFVSAPGVFVLLRLTVFRLDLLLSGGLDSVHSLLYVCIGYVLRDFWGKMMSGLSEQSPDL